MLVMAGADIVEGRTKLLATVKLSDVLEVCQRAGEN